MAVNYICSVRVWWGKEVRQVDVGDLDEGERVMGDQGWKRKNVQWQRFSMGATVIWTGSSRRWFWGYRPASVDRSHRSLPRSSRLGVTRQRNQP